MWTRRAGCGLLVLAAVMGAGCGSDAPARKTYVAQVQRTQSAFAARFDRALGRLTATSTLAQDRVTLGEFGRITDRFRRDLSDIRPPADVAAEHQGLVGVVTRFQRQFARARAQLRRGSAADRAVARTQLSSSVGSTQAQISGAIAAINRALRS